MKRKICRLLIQNVGDCDATRLGAYEKWADVAGPKTWLV
jgi:hypothetical protein